MSCQEGSFSFPQDEPARVFRTLFLVPIFSLIFLAWPPKLKSGSRVTPRMVGFSTVGTGFPFILIGRVLLFSFPHVVKRVALDFGADIRRYLLAFRVSR